MHVCPGGGVAHFSQGRMILGGGGALDPQVMGWDAGCMFAQRGWGVWCSFFSGAHDSGGVGGLVLGACFPKRVGAHFSGA